jgi:hypothetical protein
VSVELSLWAQLDVENVQVEFLYTTCTRCIVCCNNMNLFDAPFSVPSKSFISLCTYQKDVFLCTQQKDNFCFHMLGYQFWHVLIVYLKGAFPFFCMSFCHALEAVTKPHSWSSAEWVRDWSHKTDLDLLVIVWFWYERIVKLVLRFTIQKCNGIFKNYQLGGQPLNDSMQTIIPCTKKTKRFKNSQHLKVSHNSWD